MTLSYLLDSCSRHFVAALSCCLFPFFLVAFLTVFYLPLLKAALLSVFFLYQFWLLYLAASLSALFNRSPYTHLLSGDLDALFFSALAASGKKACGHGTHDERPSIHQHEQHDLERQ